MHLLPICRARTSAARHAARAPVRSNSPGIVGAWNGSPIRAGALAGAMPVVVVQNVAPIHPPRLAAV